VAIVNAPTEHWEHYTTAFWHKTERNIPGTDDVGELTSCSSNIKSTTLNWDGTCLQVAEDASSWMVAILLPTDVFHLLDGPWIHVSTMQESVHRKD
jgi:hypothetical protein